MPQGGTDIESFAPQNFDLEIKMRSVSKSKHIRGRSGSMLVKKRFSNGHLFLKDHSSNCLYSWLSKDQKFWSKKDVSKWYQITIEFKKISLSLQLASQRSSPNQSKLFCWGSLKSHQKIRWLLHHRRHCYMTGAIVTWQRSFLHGRCHFYMAEVIFTWQRSWFCHEITSI